MNKTPALFAVVLLFAAACSSSPYTPKSDRPFEPIPEFTTAQTIELENAQPSVEQVEIGGRMLANYREWTGVAIEIAARELSARGAKVAAGSQRKLKLAVTRAQYDVGFVTIATEIDLQVETANGHRATYTGKNSSAMMANQSRQVDGAMMRAVVEMLKDPKVVSYLTN